MLTKQFYNLPAVDNLVSRYSAGATALWIDDCDVQLSVEVYVETKNKRRMSSRPANTLLYFLCGYMHVKDAQFSTNTCNYSC